MAAPSGIVWGGVVNSGTAKAARIGIYRSVSNKSNTISTVSVQIWLWTRYKVTDSSNTVYFNWDATSASTSVRSNVSVSTTNTEWSTSNQVQLYPASGSITRDYTRRDGALTGNCAAKITGLDYIGSAITATTQFTIPALPYFTITYDGNGGIGTPDAHGYYYGTDTKLSSTIPTRAGYTFGGWTDGTNTYQPGATWSGTNAVNVTVYAVWNINEYTITYNDNGGTGAPSSQTKTHGTALTLSSTEPIRPNYEFMGWATTNNATTASYNAGGSYIAEGNATLYAVWKLAYKVPSIASVNIYRCNSNGAVDDYGTYFKVSFGWATSQLTGTNNVKSAKIEWKEHSATSYPSGNSNSPSVSGTNGTVTTDKLGGGNVDAEKVYDVRITVTDSTSYSPNYTRVTYTLPAAKFLIDFKNGGDGVAIGKPASLAGVFEVGFASKFTGGITGATSFDTGPTMPSIELYHATPFIDFHYGNSTVDNTSRIIESASGTLSINGYKFTKSGDASFPKALPVGSGGTGGKTALAARTNLGLTYTGIACSYTGSGTDDVTTSTTTTTVPMTVENVNTDNAFSLSNGGIKCPYAGTVAISAGVYIVPNSACHAGIYIFKNSTETVSDMRYLSSGFACTMGTRIMNVTAGDVIYLKARSMAAGKASSGNKATHLSIAYIR